MLAGCRHSPTASFKDNGATEAASNNDGPYISQYSH